MWVSRSSLHFDRHDSPLAILSATAFHALLLSNSPCSSTGLTLMGVVGLAASRKSLPSLSLEEPLT